MFRRSFDLIAPTLFYNNLSTLQKLVVGWLFDDTEKVFFLVFNQEEFVSFIK